MKQIKDAVDRAGYEAKMVDSPAAAGGLPVLSCNVKKFHFRNYCWFFPFVFNWGDIQLDATINSPDGKLVWSRSYSGRGNGYYSFTATVGKALTTILNEMSSDLASTNLKTAP